MDESGERRQRIRDALSEAGLDGLLCTLPSNVLMVSGYWPVVGGAVAVFAPDGRVGVVAPRDEEDLARKGHAEQICTSKDFDLNTVRDQVSRMLADLGVRRGRFGSDTGPFHEPSSYVAMNFWGAAVFDLVPEILVVSAREVLAHLRSVLTAAEVARVGTACRIAGGAYARGAQALRAGVGESEASIAFEAPLRTDGIGCNGVERAGGHVSVTSGPNSATAYGAYARSRDRVIEDGDLVLVHCNSFADGYWTDITRTFVLGQPNERQRRMYDAVFEARAAAHDAIRPGVAAKQVDAAAREVMTRRGFGEQFRHATGHGVGFAAIDHNALPRISTDSTDVLERGMVFNIEPAVYVKGFSGIRHCDVIAVTGSGAQVLTPFQASLEDLIV